MICLIATLLRAEDSWNITTADFKTQQVELKSLNDGGLDVALLDHQTKHIASDQLLFLQRTEKPPMSSAGQGFIALLNTHDRAAGQPKSISGENLLWNNPVVGQLTLPLKSIVGIVRDGEELPQSTGPQTEDVVTLANGDTVHGIVNTIDATNITVQQAGGDNTPVPLDSVKSIIFATIGGTTQKQSHGFRIIFADGSALTATAFHLDNTNVAMTLLDGTSATAPLKSIAGIEQIDGPVVWLSSLTPTENVQTPFLDLPWPAKMDRGVDGNPIRFSDRIFAHGIGVHSYSRLTFAIDPSYKTFRTQFAVADNLPYANVTVRIKLDDKIVKEEKDIRSGTLSQPLVIDVSGKKQLTLEVDYGQNYDVQDRFNWIEPAFLRFAPAPATSP